MKLKEASLGLSLMAAVTGCGWVPKYARGPQQQLPSISSTEVDDPDGVAGIIFCHQLASMPKIPEEIIEPSSDFFRGRVRRAIRFVLNRKVVGIRCTYFIQPRTLTAVEAIEPIEESRLYNDKFTNKYEDEWRPVSIMDMPLYKMGADGQVDSAFLGFPQKDDDFFGDDNASLMRACERPDVMYRKKDTKALLTASQNRFARIVSAAKKLLEDGKFIK